MDAREDTRVDVSTHTNKCTDRNLQSKSAMLTQVRQKHKHEDDDDLLF